jgi:N-methylhydantoinase A
MEELKREGIITTTRTYSLDLRYQGQSSTLRVSWQRVAQCEQAFHDQHRKQFGHALEMPVELVNIRAGLQAAHSPPAIPGLAAGIPAPSIAHVGVQGEASPVPLYRREALSKDQHLSGPSLISESSATTLVISGWRAKVDEVGNLLLEQA